MLQGSKFTRVYHCSTAFFISFSAASWKCLDNKSIASRIEGHYDVRLLFEGPVDASCSFQIGNDNKAFLKVSERFDQCIVFIVLITAPICYNLYSFDWSMISMQWFSRLDLVNVRALMGTFWGTNRNYIINNDHIMKFSFLVGKSLDQWWLLRNPQWISVIITNLWQIVVGHCIDALIDIFNDMISLFVEVSDYNIAMVACLTVL